MGSLDVPRAACRVPSSLALMLANQYPIPYTLYQQSQSQQGCRLHLDRLFHPHHWSHLDRLVHYRPLSAVLHTFLWRFFRLLCDPRYLGRHVRTWVFYNSTRIAGFAML